MVQGKEVYGAPFVGALKCLSFFVRVFGNTRYIVPCLFRITHPSTFFVPLVMLVEEVRVGINVADDFNFCVAYVV